MMKRKTFSSLIQKHRAFFETLTLPANQTRTRLGHILSASKPIELRLLLHLIHYIATGEIPFSRATFEQHLVPSKKLNHIKNKFGSKQVFNQLLSDSRSEQLKAVHTLLKSIPLFVAVLF
jgi:hypothetical protein